MGRKGKKKRILDEEKWRRDPTWYRRCFALRLFYLLVGPAKLKRLPRVLRRLGAEIPPGWTPADPWPPGDYMPPEIMFPPDWTPDDPMPPGVVIPPDVVFPPEWTPNDPMPPGVIIPPGTVFPPGWTADDPMPPGVIIPPGTVFPVGWTPDDPMPPGVVIPPGTVFPPGWTPNDPMPPGITIPPGTVFPVGWTPDDPMPAGVTIPPGTVFPAGWTPDDPMPPGTIAFPTTPDMPLPDSPISPTYTAPSEPGPPRPPVPPPPSGWKVYFDDTRWTPESAMGEIVWEEATQRWRVMREFGMLQELHAQGGWNIDYVPRWGKIDWTGPEGKTFTATVIDQNGATAGEITNATTSPMLIDLTWEGDSYIDKLSLGGSETHADFYITNIRFIL